MPGTKPDDQRQVDDNQDDMGRDVNNPSNRIGDRPTVDKAGGDVSQEPRKNLHKDDDAPNSRVDDL